MIEVSTATTLCLRLAALASLVTSVEYLVSPQTIDDRGLLSWRVNRLRSAAVLRTHVVSVLDVLLGFPNVLVLICLRALLSVAILTAPSEVTTNAWVIAALALCLLLWAARSPFGLDGADQMIQIIFVGFVIQAISGTELAGRAFLWFVAAQLTLSYTIAGLYKATADGWRDGTYLRQIVDTVTYGAPQVWRFLPPQTARIASIIVVAWEASFAVVFFIPWQVSAVYLAIGVGFHIANAYVMGLNNFLIAFLSAYPPLLYCLSAR
jgi:hypothetical protein